MIDKLFVSEAVQDLIDDLPHYFGKLSILEDSLHKLHFCPKACDNGYSNDIIHHTDIHQKE